MNAIGIDVSKGKSTVAALIPFGEVLASPFDVIHNDSDLKKLVAFIKMPTDDPVYSFIDKKSTEGKHYKVYMMDAANKFLRIYYAKVNLVLC